MKIVGIICEYNPLHLGHKKQMQHIKSVFSEDCAVVCLMSGNFVQRGAPAIFDKSLRAKAAVLSGADLVLELPVTCSLSSAEGFAAGGVAILSQICDYLCFGCETGEAGSLMQTAQALLSEDFSPLLRAELESGKSFPAARQAALEQMGLDGGLLAQPNDILAVEYCKAILSQNAAMQPLPIRREGSYHTDTPDAENPSATALRKLILRGNSFYSYIPAGTSSVYENAALHTLSAGERAVLAKLRTMTDDEFQALPYGSEGLWRKLMHVSRSCASLKEILTTVKSKRYTRTRLDRMVMCAFLGINEDLLNAPVPYSRILAFNEVGRGILKSVKNRGIFLNAGEASDDPYWILEQRTGDLYALFAQDQIEPPGVEAKRRVYYHKDTQL